jgi:hypothetical protein
VQPRFERSAVAIAVAIALIVGGCETGAAATASPPPEPSAATTPSTPLSASPSAMLPADLVGMWVGNEDDANLGETWATTYRIGSCRQYDKPWKKPADDQRCGEWTGDATVEGAPAHCAASLYWLEQDGEAFVFLASAASGGKVRTIPHPYVKIDDAWYCWDTFRVWLTPGASGTFAVETVGAGALAGAFTATEGTVTRSDGP